MLEVQEAEADVEEGGVWRSHVSNEGSCTWKARAGLRGSGGLPRT